MTAWPTLVPLLALTIPLSFGLGAAFVPRHAPLRQGRQSSVGQKRSQRPSPGVTRYSRVAPR